jgi:hypothetical protein
LCDGLSPVVIHESACRSPKPARRLAPRIHHVIVRRVRESRALFNELFRPLSLRKPVVSGFQFRRSRLCYKFLMKITEQWLLFTYVNGEFTPLSKPFKSKAAAEKARLKLPEREQRKVSMGVIRIMK